MNAQHSPLPWKIGNSSDTICDSENLTIADLSLCFMSMNATDANAALIVRCVNSHEALVAACEAALNNMLLCGADQSISQAAMAELHAALALAKEGK